MAPNKTADLILQQWTAALKNKDRSKDAMPDNFDELFSDLKKAGISFDDAHELLPVATKAHLPTKAVLKHVWAGGKALHRIFASEAEFSADWNESIKLAATDAFFSNYPLKINEDDDGEPKVYGNISAKEYRLQRKISNMYKSLDTTELERKLKERESVSDGLNNVLGNEDGSK